jgi:hypothetical protein
MEAHYKVMFTQIIDDLSKEPVENAFKIDSIEVDVVYGTAN